jgi:hypothetical protein
VSVSVKKQIKGLPEALPEGETLLWQGRPSWRALAVRAFHVRLIAFYFVALLAWRSIPMLQEGLTAANVTNLLWLLPLPAAAIGITAALAWLYARTTIYSITDRRVVMHFGAALPLTLNLPFSAIGTAAAKVYRDGAADIPLSLTGKGRIAYIHLWPHARPWQLRNPQPMLRCVPEGQRIAALLAKALENAQPQPHPPALALRAKADARGETPEHFAPAAA